MTEKSWEMIEPERYEDHWSPFDTRFHFRAGISADRWPAIQEPTPSVTLDLSPLFDGGQAAFAAGQRAVGALALLAMTRVTAVADRLLVLDWQHPSHWFWPHQQALGDDVWPVEVFPNGDYVAFLTEDMTNGTFGHPWEQTLCVFGAGFVGVLAPMLSSWLPVKRAKT